MAAHPKKGIPVKGLGRLWGVCGQGDLHRHRKNCSLKAMGKGLEEQMPSKPALMESQPALAQLEGVCCKCLCPFLLILLFSGWLCQSVQQLCAPSSPRLFPLPLPWIQKCKSSPGATALRHPCWLPQRGSPQPGRRPWCDAAAVFISSQLQLSFAEKHKPE